MNTRWYTSRFNGSESFRNPMRPGDLIIHFRTSLFGGDPTVLDFWVMKGGEQFVMTASEEEFPPGFELHPTETRNALARKMMRKLKEGWKPGEIMAPPNIWRVRAGDRVTFMGQRPHMETGEFFGLFEFDTCALAYWLGPDGEMPFLEGALGVCPTGDGPQAEVDAYGICESPVTGCAPSLRYGVGTGLSRSSEES